MRNKLIFVAGLGLGYVLGARAGRERYEQIARASRKFMEHPTVQETTGLIQAKTGTLVNTAKDVLNNKAANTKIGEKIASMLGGFCKSTDTSVKTEPLTLEAASATRP